MNRNERTQLLKITEAARRLAELCPILGASALYECDAVGPTQPRFLNAAVLLQPELDPESLLKELLEIERQLGRVRRERWGPRRIDLDILFIDAISLDLPGLVVPHARLSERTFALRPLLDVLPMARDPKTGRPYHELLDRLTEPTLHRVAASTDWWPARTTRNHE